METKTVTCLPGVVNIIMQNLGDQLLKIPVESELRTLMPGFSPCNFRAMACYAHL